MFKAFLMGLMVLGLVLAQGCATTPTRMFVPETGQVVDVPAGTRPMVVNIGDPTLRSGATVPMVEPSDVYRHVENMATINQRAQSDTYRHDETINRDNNNTAARVLDTLSRGAQDRQHERTYRSQNLQRTLSDAYRSYTISSGGQKMAPKPSYSAPRQSAPRAIRAPQQILPRRR